MTVYIVMVEKLILCAAIIFVMPLVFNICNGYPAGTGHLSWYLTNTKSSSSTVPKISRVILGLLLGSHHFSLVPRRGEGGGEKERLVSTVCACALISKNSWKTVSLAGISVTLTSVRLLIFTVEDAYHSHTLCER